VTAARHRLKQEDLWPAWVQFHESGGFRPVDVTGTSREESPHIASTSFGPAVDHGTQRLSGNRSEGRRRSRGDKERREKRKTVASVGQTTSGQNVKVACVVH
jgi:hypothetical protein